MTDQEHAVISGNSPLTNQLTGQCTDRLTDRQNEAFFVPVSLAAGGFDKRYSINLLGLLGYWRRYWYAILATAVITTLLGAWYAGTRIPIYESTLAIAESNVPITSLTQQQQGSLSLGALLSGAPENSSLARFRSTFFSVQLAEVLRDKYNLYNELYSGEWDEDAQTWQEVKYFSPNQSIKRGFGLPTYEPPSPHRLKQYLMGAIMVTPLPEDGTVLYQYKHPDPTFAKKLLGIMFTETNELIRQKDLADYSQLLDSLKQQIRTTTDVNQRDALYQLTAQYQYKIALASLENVPYAAEQVDLIAPNVPVAPSPLKILIAAFLFGVFASAGVLTLRYFFKSSP